MGIKGLLPALNDIIHVSHLEAFRGKIVAVDTYAWLHRAVYACSLELCLGETTERHIEWCLQRLALLEAYDIKPVFVFDGERLPLKHNTEASRAASRQFNLQQGHAYLRAGNREMAIRHFQRAVDVTPQMARALQKRLREWLEARREHDHQHQEEQDQVDAAQQRQGHQSDGLTSSGTAQKGDPLKQLEKSFQAPGVIVAPYEADAQLAYLSRKGLVEAVITEDSDLIVYGCQKIIFKLENSGMCRTLDASDLPRSALLAPFLPQLNAISNTYGLDSNASSLRLSPPLRSDSDLPALAALKTRLAACFRQNGISADDAWRIQKLAALERTIQVAPIADAEAGARLIASTQGLSPHLLILQLICALAGCDYLGSMTGVGIMSARDATLRAIGDVPAVLEALRKHSLALSSVQRILLEKPQSNEQQGSSRQNALRNAWSAQELWWSRMWRSVIEPDLLLLHDVKAATGPEVEQNSTSLTVLLGEFESFYETSLPTLLAAQPCSWHVCPDAAFYAALAFLAVRELSRQTSTKTASSNSTPLSPTGQSSFSALPATSSTIGENRTNLQRTASPTSVFGGSPINSFDSDSNLSPGGSSGRADPSSKQDEVPGEAEIDHFLSLFVVHSTPTASITLSPLASPSLSDPIADSPGGDDSRCADSLTAKSGGFEVGVDDIDDIANDPTRTGYRGYAPNESANSHLWPAGASLRSPSSSQVLKASVDMLGLETTRITVQRSGGKSHRGIASPVSLSGWGQDVDEIDDFAELLNSQPELKTQRLSASENPQLEYDPDARIPLPLNVLNGYATPSTFDLLQRTGRQALLPRTSLINYARGVLRCLLAFNHQVVFDPHLRKRVHLSTFPSQIEDPTLVLAVGARARRQARLHMQNRLRQSSQVQPQAFIQTPAPRVQQGPSPQSNSNSLVGESRPVTIALSSHPDSGESTKVSLINILNSEGKISFGRSRSPSSAALQLQLGRIGTERISLGKRSTSKSSGFLPIVSTTASSATKSNTAQMLVSSASTSPFELPLATTSELEEQPIQPSHEPWRSESNLTEISASPQNQASGSSNERSETPTDPTIAGVNHTLWSLASLSPLSLFAALKEVLLATCLHLRPVSRRDACQLTELARGGPGGYLGWNLTTSRARAHALGLLHPETLVDPDILRLEEKSHPSERRFSYQAFNDLSPLEQEALSELEQEDAAVVSSRVSKLHEITVMHQQPLPLMLGTKRNQGHPAENSGTRVKLE